MTIFRVVLRTYCIYHLSAACFVIGLFGMWRYDVCNAMLALEKNSKYEGDP
jgi:hypothetical protein